MTSEGAPFVCKSPVRRPFVCRAGTGRRKGIGRARRHEHGRPKGLECEWRRRLRKGEARSNRLLQNLCTASYIQRKGTGTRADTETSDGLSVMSMEGQKAWNANGDGDCERAKPEAIDFCKIHAQYYIRRKKTACKDSHRRTGRRKGSVRAKRHEHGRPKGI